jgi:hypothetical protein
MNADSGLRGFLHKPGYTNETYLRGWFELPAVAVTANLLSRLGVPVAIGVVISA